jgi:hypothetical protein
MLSHGCHNFERVNSKRKFSLCTKLIDLLKFVIQNWSIPIDVNGESIPIFIIRRKYVALCLKKDTSCPKIVQDISVDLFAASIHRLVPRTYTYINYMAIWKQLPVEINLSALLRQFSLIRLIYRLWNCRAFSWCKLNYLSGIMPLNENLSVAQHRLMTKSCSLRNSYD